MIPTDKLRQFARKAAELRDQQLAAGNDDQLTARAVIDALDAPPEEIDYFAQEVPTLVPVLARRGLVIIEHEPEAAAETDEEAGDYWFRLTAQGIFWARSG
jgi:hypothetical protein